MQKTKSRRQKLGATEAVAFGFIKNHQVLLTAIFERRASGRIGEHAYLGDLNLDRGVVLGGDESVGGGALSRDVDIHNVSFVVLHLYYS